MKSEHDPTLFFDENAIGDTDTEEVRVLRTDTGYTLRSGSGSPIHIVLETLALALVQGSTIHLVIP
jgi:hypothetical protein